MTRIYCNETKKIFPSIKAAAEWIKNEKNLKSSVLSIQTILIRHVNGSKARISKTNGKNYPSFGNVKTVHGYTFKKIIKDTLTKIGEVDGFNIIGNSSKATHILIGGITFKLDYLKSILTRAKQVKR